VGADNLIYILREHEITYLRTSIDAIYWL